MTGTGTGTGTGVNLTVAHSTNMRAQVNKRDKIKVINFFSSVI
jgi:hypothetical protein